MLRRDLRELVKTALLDAGTDAGRKVYTPRDWPTVTGQYPNILIQTPKETKISKGRFAPAFDTTVHVAITGRVEAGTAEKAEDLADTLADQIELAILTNYDLIKVLQQFSSVETDVLVSAEGEMHIGEVQMMVAIEVFQEFDPIESTLTSDDDLERVDIHIDALAPFDESGTYTGSPFPDSVTDAPRTLGPDGRDEGALTFDNLQD